MVGPSRAAVTASKPECKRGSHDGVLVVFVAGVSVVSDIPEVQTSARRALVMAGAVTFVAVGSGVWRSSPLIRDSMHRTPMVIRVIVRASFAGVAALAGMGALVATVAVASSFGSITEMFASLNPTTFDALVLLVLSLGYVPVLVSWSVSYRNFTRARRAHLTLRAGCPGNASSCFPTPGGCAGDRRPRKLGITRPGHRVRRFCGSARFPIRLP